MRKRLLNVILIVVCLSFQSCYKEEVFYDGEADSELKLSLILRLNGKDCSLDESSGSLRYSVSNDPSNDFSPLVQFQDYSEVYFNDRKLKNHSVNNLEKIVINKDYSVKITTNGKARLFTLTFTNLPIVQIVSTDHILNEPKTLARLFINYPGTSNETTTLFVGLEQRGASAQSYLKKSFGFSCLKSMYIDDKVSMSLFGMKANQDWILDAMYIDKARLRNSVAFNVWSRFDSSGHHAISSTHVELYINREHQGIYCFNEMMNAEWLGLTDENAVLYKAIAWENGATNFETPPGSPPAFDYWDGWEQKWPDASLRLNWDALKDLRDLVVNKNDSEFVSSISSSVDLDNLIDYYILLNLLSAGDNTGKNNFLMRENADAPLRFIPWDLDLTFGLSWPGVHTGTGSVLGNNLFKRLLELNPEGFKSRLKSRWVELRNTALLESELLEIFQQNFNNIKISGAINIENRKWNESINIDDEYSFIENWLHERLEFLDEYFDVL